ncbi:MAG: ABC transporter permease [Phycisphaerales bacterium]
MMRFILRRLAQVPVTLAAIYTLTVLLAWAVPGNPLENPDGPQPPPEAVEAMKARYNLDSTWRFYWSYLDGASGVGALRDALAGRARSGPVFDLGPSLQYRDQTVGGIISQSLPVSVSVGAAAILIALVLGLAAGISGALRPGGWLDQLSLSFAMLGVSIPAFVVGTVLLMVAASWLGLGIVGKWGTPEGLLFPALTLGLPYAAYVARLSREGMIEALASDYVRTARAKGLSPARVVMVHALRNALLPVVTFLGPACAGAMTGSFVVESIFALPGLGQHFVAAVQNKDLFLIIGVVMTFSTMLVLFNLAVDVMYRWIDPRTVRE